MYNVIHEQNQKKMTAKSNGFDFSSYEKDAKDDQELISLKKKKKPRVTNLKSKYSPGEFELENLSQIKLQISKFSIRVASNTDSLRDLWDLYGCLNEYWARIQDIFGSLIINDVKKIQNMCYKSLIASEKTADIERKLYRRLLYLRDTIYMIAQRHNLSIEVEKSSKGFFEKAKKGIIE